MSSAAKLLQRWGLCYLTYKAEPPAEVAFSHLLSRWSLVLTVILIAELGFRFEVEAQVPLLRVMRPAADETVRGTFAFAAALGNSAPVSTVEFLIGSKRLGITRSKSPHIAWNTGFASDGSYSVQVLARDPAGQVIASGQQRFTINNHGNVLTLSSPRLDHPLSGTVQLVLHGIDRNYYPALWLVNVDGKVAGVRWTDHTGQHDTSVTIPIDTAQFANGKHELYIAMHSDFWTKNNAKQISWHNWRGGLSRVVTFDNRHRLMEIVSNYLHVYLEPGQSTVLACRRLITDGSSEPCISPAFTSDAAGILNVSPAGVIKAGNQQGFSTIKISDSGKTTDTHVWVRRGLGVPHFSGNGRMLHSYLPGQSLFVIAPFALQAKFVEHDPELLAAVRRAGINTLSQGFYSNPRNLRTSFENWRQSYNASFLQDWTFSREHGFHILATGDEVCRNIGAEAWWTLNWPSGRRAVQYSFQSLAGSGVAIGVDMVDEASMLWGATPTPPGRIGAPGSFTSISCVKGRCQVSWPNNPINDHRFPSGTSFALRGSRTAGLDTPPGKIFNATQITPDSFEFLAAAPVNGNFNREDDSKLEFLWWAGNIGGCPTQPCNPPVPNDALLRITGWLHQSEPRVPVSWPALGQSPLAVQANWIGKNSISDYASHYWVPLELRHTYTWAQGIRELGYWMADSFYQRQPLMMLDRPQLMLISVAGPDYVKKTAGGVYYNPPRDVLSQPPMSAAGIVSTMMTAAALGTAGVRLYAFDNPGYVHDRSAAPLGSDLQTGVFPTAHDPIIQTNWQALSNTSRLLTRLAPYLFGLPLNSPAYGQGIVTAARQSRDGTMLMIINDNDWEHAIAVDFTPYSNSRVVTRYLIGSAGFSRTSYRRMQEKIMLQPGQSAVYLFQSKRNILTTPH